MRTRPVTGAVTAALLGLLLAACGGPEGVEAPTSDEPTVPTDSATTAAPTTPSTTTAAADPSAGETAEAEPMALGPQTCGSVTSVLGDPVTVEIVVGDVDCAFAEDLLDTYYNDPPSPPEGSGGYVMIDDWECNSSSSQEPGRASTCHGPDDGLIVAVPGGGDAGEPGPVCSQIDQPTLDQLFPDGRFDEARCQSYIDGENSIG